MMYIFEGVDHAGKDTLIDALKQSRQRKGLPFIPTFDGSNVYDEKDCPPSIENPYDFQKAIGWEIVRFCQQTHYDVIINRFTWSEIVYSQVLRNGADWSWYFNIMDKQLHGIAKIIYVHAPLEVIISRIEKSERRKSDLIKQSIPSLLREYDNLIDMTDNDIKLVNTGDLDLFDLAKIDRLQQEIFNDK